MNFKTPIGRLRILAILEGISFLLFAITMPLKYIWGIKEPNFYVGMTHGWLFIVYIIMCVQCIFIYEWRFRDSAKSLIASLVPFGTFYMEYKLFRKVQEPLA
ncbi:MAG: DUF3817 domain-containing protein [Marinoscillum sp.]